MIIVQEQEVVLFITNNYSDIETLDIIGDYEEDIDWFYNGVEYKYCVKLFINTSEDS